MMDKNNFVNNNHQLAYIYMAFWGEGGGMQKDLLLGPDLISIPGRMLI